MLAEILNMPPEERGIYLASLKEKWDNYSMRQTALLEGKAEGNIQAKTEIAADLKKLGLSLDLISRGTGLPLDVVEQL